MFDALLTVAQLMSAIVLGAGALQLALSFAAVLDRSEVSAASQG